MDLDVERDPVTDQPNLDRKRGELREHQVIGPPGTGKTHYLSVQIPRAADVFGADGILVCSLTRAAAKEVGGRIDLPREQVGTLHAHCYRALDRPELAETGPGLKAWNEWVTGNGRPGLLRIEAGSAEDQLDHFADRGAGGATEGEQLLARLATLRALRAPRDLWPPKVQAFADDWNRFKRETSRVDFTDLLEQALTDLPTAPGDPAVILVDEAQDHSRLEFALVRKWAGQAQQAVVVGDPDQAIFEWRGADPQAMLDPAHEPASRTVLSRSRRVPAAVHRYAVDWIGRVDGRQPVAYEPRFNDPNDEASEVAPGEVHRTGLRWANAEGLAGRLADELAQTNDRGEPRTVMVLATCAYMLDPLVRELRRQGIPFGNPYRPTHGGWNPLRGAERLRSLLLPIKEVHGEDARVWRWDDVHRWLEPMRAKGNVVRGGKSQVELWARPAPFEKESPQVSLSRLFGIFEDPDGAADALMSEAPLPLALWWHGRLRDDKARQARYGVRVLEQHGPAALMDTPRLIVGTVHSVKGGEADTVIVFPDLSRQGYVEGWAQAVRRAATYRVFYVAFTRARERLLLGSASDPTFVPFPDPEAP
jgi:superfamily I DNA/RNA helicase